MQTARTRRQPAHGHSDESGVALVSVIALTAVLTLFAVIVINTTLRALDFSRDHQDWNAALAAAEAGVDDFLARLNRDRGYYENYVNDIDPVTGFNQNPAIDEDLWAALPESDAFYHYSIDASEVVETGTVVVTSTGLVGDETRTVQVRVRPEAFFDFLYLTDFETMDPLISGPSDPTACDRQWGAVPAKHSSCVQLRFTSVDVLSGPVHSNDAIVIDGNPSFLGEVTTAIGQAQGGGFFNYSSPRGVLAPIPGDSRFARDGDPRYTGRLEFPATNVAMATDAANVGCVYYGPTYIHLQGETMTVRSPLSAQAPGAPATDAGRCAGGNVNNLTGFQSGIPIPPVIYVNHATGCGSFNNSNHPLGIDRREESVTSLRTECEYGDAFVWGELGTRASIGARNNINIIWDLYYEDGEWQDGTNVLGLIADNFVQIRQPRNNSNNGNRIVVGQAPFPSGQPVGATDVRPSIPASGYFDDPTVHAAIVSLERSFRIQNHDRIGVRGTFTLRGSLTQKYRGPVGVGSASGLVHGVSRDYDYDARLRFVSPPYFIDPVRAQFVVRGWAEVRADAHPTGLPDLP